MERNFKKLNAEIGAEFDKYVAEHPKWAIKHIPINSLTFALRKI